MAVNRLKEEEKKTNNYNKIAKGETYKHRM